ncbi:MAG: YihY/virulence factor BrkB family protein [Caulobacteraceae bacterium]
MGSRSAAEADGGRTPAEVPARASPLARWRRAAFSGLRRFLADRIPAAAAGVTYYVLLAIFPALGAVVSIYGLIADPARAAEKVGALGGFLPGGAISVLQDQLWRLAAAGRGSLSLALAVGLLISIWSSNSGMKALIGGLNAAFEAKEKRNFLRLNLTSLAFTAAAIALAVLSMAIVIAAPSNLAAAGLSGAARLAWVRWPAMLILTSLLISLLDRFGPCRPKGPWRWLNPGGILAALAWMGMSALYSWYVAHFGHFDRTYGSLGAIFGFMVWIWLSVMLILLGAELNAELAREAAHGGDENRPRARSPAE